MLRRLFRLDEHGSSVRVELLGGLTTFLTTAALLASRCSAPRC
ncbi:MAG: hypothetical protein AB7O37_14125 [Vicinamibacteria bacterium]